MALVIAVMVITLFPQMAYDQFFNTGLLWVNGHVDMATRFGDVPVAWFASFDSIVNILVVPFLIALWAKMARLGREPDSIAKIGIGAALQAGSALLMIGAALSAGDGRTSVWLPMLGFASTGLAFFWYWPTLLAFVSRHAPAKINAQMMSFAYLVVFVSQVVGGLLGSLYEWIGPVNFWIGNTAIALCGAVAAFVFGPVISRALSSTTSHPTLETGAPA